MIIAAVADTHGKTDSIINELSKITVDHLLFAGDYYQDGQIIARKLKLPSHIVAGNSDTTHRAKQEEIITFLNKDIWLVHGHQYGVKRDLNRLFYRARELNVDAVVFGHTHCPYCEKTDRVWMINPGSPVRPRLPGYGSFAIIEIDENGLRPRIMNIMQSDQ